MSQNMFRYSYIILVANVRRLYIWIFTVHMINFLQKFKKSLKG